MLGVVFSRVLRDYHRTKYIPIPDQIESVSTDIVYTSMDTSKSSLVIPAKITTRERVVQPFAHQRILDSVFSVGRYKSILMCVSEIQRKKDNTANEICVPGTIRLFQSHLAKMSGILYLDPPYRYLQDDITSVIHVGTIGAILASGLAGFLRDGHLE